jgi:hypothetical protein
VEPVKLVHCTLLKVVTTNKLKKCRQICRQILVVLSTNLSAFVDNINLITVSVNRAKLIVITRNLLTTEQLKFVDMQFIFVNTRQICRQNKREVYLSPQQINLICRQINLVLPTDKRTLVDHLTHICR